MGHSVRHDLKAMGLAVPYVDTAFFEDADTAAALKAKDTPGLKMLCQRYLNSKIQDGWHSSIIDARATMALFRMREEYLETRILDFDPALEEMNKRNRQRMRPKPSHQVNSNQVVADAAIDYAQAMLLMKQKCYHEI